MPDEPSPHDAPPPGGPDAAAPADALPTETKAAPTEPQAVPTEPEAVPAGPPVTPAPPEPDVLVRLEPDGVATVTLNRPAKLNALTPGMQRRYVAALLALDADPACRAIVVTGAGRGFCAGADLSGLDQLGEGSGLEPEAGDTEAPEVDAGAPMELSTPVIAAVNGPVAGMGFSYLLMCDVRFVGEGVRMSSTFAKLGLVAEWGTATLLTRIVGLGNASDILLSGRMIEADEALRMGLVQRVCPAGELLPQTYAWAREVATTTSPHAHAVMKKQLRDAATAEPKAAFDESVALMFDSFGWGDLQEGLTARQEKRPPQFPGWPAS